MNLSEKVRSTSDKRPKLYRTVIIITLIALIGLLTVQVFWFVKAYGLEEKQFDARVNLALRNIAHTMLRSQGNSIRRIEPVIQTASNTYHVELNGMADYAMLDSVVRSSFREHQLLTPFELTVYDHELNDILLGNYYEKGAQQEGDPTCMGRVAPARAVDFAITFPGKRTDIMGALGLWVFTAFTFVLILVLFGVMVIDLSRQKKLADMKADFINNMTHELQTPITNISIASEVLRTAADHMEGTKALHYANIIHQENQRLKIQVEQVLQTAMMEKGDFGLKKNEVDIHSLIEEVIHTFQVRIANRHGQIRSQLEALHPLVYADRFHLMNVLYNLLDNAEKYSPACPEITITTRNKDNGVLIAIADKGIGISNEVQPYVFDKFYRAPSGNVHDVKGFGLGLTYVRNIVDAHQGNVSLWSELSKGSRFELYFHNC